MFPLVTCHPLSSFSGTDGREREDLDLATHWCQTFFRLKKACPVKLRTLTGKPTSSMRLVRANLMKKVLTGPVAGPPWALVV